MGEAFASRVAASLLKAAGLPELVAQSTDDYRRLALGLGQDRAALTKIKEKLELARLASPLFDTARFTRHLEAAYGHMWRRRQQGEGASGFTITQAVN
jgi:predicted O-linked N-acetylglucosamine transferase (SPINDLY family)